MSAGGAAELPVDWKGRGGPLIPLLLAACAPVEPDPDVAETPEELGPQLAFDADVLDFGAVRVGSAVTLPVAVRNVGDAPLTLGPPHIEDPDHAYTVGEAAALSVPVGGAVSVDVTFTASAKGSPSTRLLIPSDDPDDPLAELILVGTASAPVATIDPPSFDFGTLEEACVDSRAFTITNAGDAALVVTAVAVEGGQEAFTVDVAEDDNGPLPWTIAPGEARRVWAAFGPGSDLVYAGGLTVSSDDPANPHAAAPLDGVGRDSPPITDNFVTLGKGLDIVFAVGGTDADGLADALVAALPALTSPLLAANVRFEIGAIRADDGCLLNGLLADETMTYDEQSAALARLLATTGTAHTLTLLERAVSLTGTEACNHDLVRERSNLVLIGVSDTAAPAPQAHGVYSAAFEAAKDDADDSAAWAVMPDGGDCGEPDAAWTEVTVATGGSYLSVCDDLPTSLAAIAEGAIERQDAFGLSSTPWPETIVVSVDGEYSHTFTYDAGTNEVLFDEGVEPPIGTPVRIVYDAVPACLGDGP